jgi:hypothetical protein
MLWRIGHQLQVACTTSRMPPDQARSCRLCPSVLLSATDESYITGRGLEGKTDDSLSGDIFFELRIYFLKHQCMMQRESLTLIG